VDIGFHSVLEPSNANICLLLAETCVRRSSRLPIAQLNPTLKMRAARPCPETRRAVPPTFAVPELSFRDSAQVCKTWRLDGLHQHRSSRRSLVFRGQIFALAGHRAWWIARASNRSHRTFRSSSARTATPAQMSNKQAAGFAICALGHRCAPACLLQRPGCGRSGLQI
jgi:hypothetical protein